MMTTDIKEAARASARISGTALERTTIDGKVVAYRGYAVHYETANDLDGIVIIGASCEALERVVANIWPGLDIDWTLVKPVLMTQDKERT
jgi:hypothetical protein